MRLVDDKFNLEGTLYLTGGAELFKKDVFRQIMVGVVENVN